MSRNGKGGVVYELERSQQDERQLQKTAEGMRWKELAAGVKERVESGPFLDRR